MSKSIGEIKVYLDDLLAGLADDAVVYLTIEEPVEGEDPAESVWHGTVTDLFEKDLDVILESLDDDARLYINGRSGTDVFALAAPGVSEGPITWHLAVPEGGGAPAREVLVITLEPLGDAEILMEYVVDIPVPGIGGVEVLGTGDPVEPDDEGVEAYLDRLDELFGEGDEDDERSEDEEEPDSESVDDDDEGDRQEADGDGADEGVSQPVQGRGREDIDDEEGEPDRGSGNAAQAGGDRPILTFTKEQWTEMCEAIAASSNRHPASWSPKYRREWQELLAAAVSAKQRTR